MSSKSHVILSETKDLLNTYSIFKNHIILSKQLCFDFSGIFIISLLYTKEISR